MLRPTFLTLSLALLAGCSPSASPPAAGSPQVDGSGSDKPAEQELVVKEVVILGVTPGKTTLEEFKKRFHVAEVKEAAAQGVLTADAGPGAVLEGDGLKFDRLTGAFLDGVLIDLKARGMASAAPHTLSTMLGPPESAVAAPQKWTIGGITVIRFEAADGIPATLQAFDTGKSLQAFDRSGFPGLGGHAWDD